MNKLKSISKEILRNKTILLRESSSDVPVSFSGKAIINIDIQPEYNKNIIFDLSEWGRFINKCSKSNDIVFLYNGKDSLGMISEDEYITWLIDTCDIDNDTIDNCTFYDKGYAFFRYCMDSFIEDKQIVNLVQFMSKNNIRDSREFTKDLWDDFVIHYGNKDIRELMECSDDMIYIPDVMDFLRDYNNIVLLGGSVTECLKEVEIAIMALNKPYSVYSRFTY